MSSVLSAEISATCNALGYLDEKTNKYYSDSNTLETVKDLIRYLRRDDESHSIRRQLGETKILQTDLLHLLKNYHQENDLFDVLLRLIMNLTTPPLLLFNFEIPTDKIVRNLYLEMEDHLKSYKEAFVDDGIWAVFSTHLSKILEIDHNERGEESSVKIERILVLVRNVLFVPSDVMEKRPDNDASIHDQVLWALHHSGLLDIILYITTNPMEQSYYMYILEIMFYMLKDQQPHELANAALERSQSEKVRDEAELINMRNLEQNKKQSKIKKYAGTRHSRFGGTFVVQSMKSISNNELISHQPLNKLESLNFDVGKSKKKTPKNRMPLINNTVERRSAFTIRLFLKEFCIEFLNGAYNSIMQYVKSILVRSGENIHDESYYFWAINFFMAFNRNYKFEIKLVSETLSVQIFHYVQQQSENYFDLIRTDKKKLLIWSRRLHIALLSYKELFLTLLTMDKSSDEIVRESSKVIKSNIFYVPEYREFILTLLIMYDELKMTDLYLRDLMETQHLFLKMFESFCKEDGSIVVQKKLKNKRKKTTRNAPMTSQVTEKENLNSIWDKASPQLSAVLESGDFLTEEVPFDAVSDIPIDEQKSTAMKKIQKKLRHSEFESAISIMRAAREVWPENNYFGSDNMTLEEEFLALREIFFTDFGEEIVQNKIFEVDGDEEDEDEGIGELPEAREVSFSFKEFLQRLPHPKIIRACGIALRSFDTNSLNTNHSIIKLMHRIAFDCKMYVMMFQVSLFRTFQRILEMKKFPQYKELVKFSIFILRQFFKVAQTNDKIFIECLFWKTKKEAYEIENGYGTSIACSAVTPLWAEEEELELRSLFEEYKDRNIEEDIIDWILKNLVNITRSRRMVIKKLREMDLVDEYKRKSKKNKDKYSQNWTEEEETQLTELYHKYKNSSDPVSFILNDLGTNRPKNKVINKMISLGLIQDKKELRKKKKGGTKSERTQIHFGPDFIPTDTESDSDASTSNPNNLRNPSHKRSFSVNTNKSEVTRLIEQSLNDGRLAGLEWLKESISDAIHDFEEDSEDIPLVPLSEDVENCMDNLEFQALLKALGLSEPFDEQERYWRIPEGIGLDTLKNNYELLTSSLKNDNDANVVENESQSLQCENNTPVEILNETDHTFKENIHTNDIINDELEYKGTEEERVTEIHLNSTSKRNRIFSNSQSPPQKRIRIEEDVLTEDN